MWALLGSPLSWQVPRVSMEPALGHGLGALQAFQLSCSHFTKVKDWTLEQTKNPILNFMSIMWSGGTCSCDPEKYRSDWKPANLNCSVPLLILEVFNFFSFRIVIYFFLYKGFLWNSIWKYLRKWKPELLYDPAIPSWAYIQNSIHYHRDIFTPCLLLLLFTVAKKRNQLVVHQQMSR